MHLYDAFLKNPSLILNDEFGAYLHDNGYLDEYQESYNGLIDESDIINALSNIPQIIFEMTSQCNLKCKYCCYNDCYTTFQNREEGVISFETAKAVIDFVASVCNDRNNSSVNSPLVFSFYGGEPLLYGDKIKEIVNYIKSKDFHNRVVKFSITTNATLIHKHIDFLAENQFAILVSLDGDSQHNANRVFHNNQPTFDTVFRNLKYCQNSYPEFFKTIRFNSVYTNASVTDEIIEFFLSSFGKYPTFSPLHEPQESQNAYIIKDLIKKIEPPTDIRHSFNPQFFIELPIHKKVAHVLSKLINNSYVFEWQLTDENDNKVPTSTCVPFSKKLYVTSNGDLIQCEKINRDCPIGTVRGGKVKINAKAVADQYNQKVYEHINVCNKCYFQQACNQCAFSIDNRCTQFMTQEAFAENLAEVFSYIENHPEIIELINKNLILH